MGASSSLDVAMELYVSQAAFTRPYLFSGVLIFSDFSMRILFCLWRINFFLPFFRNFNIPPTLLRNGLVFSDRLSSVLARLVPSKPSFLFFSTLQPSRCVFGSANLTYPTAPLHPLLRCGLEPDTAVPHAPHAHAKSQSKGHQCWTTPTFSCVQIGSVS